MKLTLLIASLFVASLSAQTNSEHLIINPTSSGTAVTRADGTIGWTSLATNSFTAIDSTGHAYVYYGSSIPEATKMVGPGISILKVKESAKRLSADLLAPSAYVKLATSIGLHSSATDEARVLDAIEDLGLTVFDWNKVNNFLTHQAFLQGSKTRWVWTGMREADIEVMRKSNQNGQVIDQVGFMLPSQYDKRIPARVLARVAEILEKVPDAVFLCSDFAVLKPDPFLAITTARLMEQHKIWIIEQWQEPTWSDDGLSERASR